MNDLIFDRTELDILNLTEKSYYNYTDLNRIENWCEHLSNILTGYNYYSHYIKRNNVDNILKNGSLDSSTDGWTINAYNTAVQKEDYLNIKATATASSGTYPNTQAFDTISGNSAETRQLIYVCAKVRGKPTNASFPRVYLSYYKNGSNSVSYSNLSSIDGLTGNELNDGEWHTMSSHLQTYNINTGDYFDYNRIAFGISTTTIDDEMDIKEILLINLTKIFGRGNEPSKTWCDNNLTNYSAWQMWHFPTKSDMERIRQNVNRLKQAYFSFTQIPQNLEYMTWRKANDIEKILYEINTLLNNMISQFYYCGEVFSGEVYK